MSEVANSRQVKQFAQLQSLRYEKILCNETGQYAGFKSFNDQEIFERTVTLYLRCSLHLIFCRILLNKLRLLIHE